ncbi:Uncharacterised protein [Trueperella bialowiezensis]|uniref:Uncharacterized protein n=1 Tax=Trueperella bialowiezensis TaxID=312285 RepID=A0A448PG53_9ACTO|nr:Uncharacterised protein [Trueperella bialowiezensis]
MEAHIIAPRVAVATVEVSFVFVMGNIPQHRN